MKKIVLIFALGIGIVACNPINNKMQDEKTELVKNYVQAVENMDFNAMENFLADDYVGIGPSYGDTINKFDAVENWKWNVENLYEKIHYNISRFVYVNIPDGDSKGDWVANWAELNIVYKNNQGEVTIWANTNYKIENGKIAKSFTFYNEADALRQLGYKIVKPEPVEE